MCAHSTAHARVLETHRRVELTYADWDTSYYDYDKDGEGCTRFHPAALPPRHTMLPVSEMAAATDLNQHIGRIGRIGPRVMDGLALRLPPSAYG